MRGDKVVVRAFRNEALIRRVWGANERVIYVVSPETFDSLSTRRVGAEPIGFPREDVFEHIDGIKKGRGGETDWSGLRNYTPKEA